MPKDCVIEEDRIIFVVGPGKVGQVIGKGGMNIRQVKEVFQREVNVVAYAEKLEDFVRNTLAPAKVTKVDLVEKRDGKAMLIVDVDPEDRGRAIGKSGRNIARARMLVKRHFGIENVVLS
jgi:N utilization substance protein A